MGNLTSVEFDKGLFFVYNDNGEGLIYSPLQGKFFTADGDAQLIVTEYISSSNRTTHEFHGVLLELSMLDRKKEPEVPKNILYRPTALMLSLSDLCNLRCTYCYAEAGNTSKVLSWDVIVQAIDKMFANAIETKNNNVEICFHGTGETLVLWKTFKRAVQYALSHKSDLIEITFSLVTNGTLLNGEKVKFLAENDFIITLSMDGVQSVQDKQRPAANGNGSYADVVKGIKLLVDFDIRFIVRSTITGENIDLMPDFVKSMC